MRQGTVLQSVIALEQLRDSTWLCGAGCVPPGCFYALALADRNDIIEARLDRWTDAWRKEYREAITAFRTFAASCGVFPRTLTTYTDAVAGIVPRTGGESRAPRQVGKPVMY